MPSVYIGQTGCSLGVIIDEHRAAIQHAQTEVSAVAEHVCIYMTPLDGVLSTTILYRRVTPKMLILESWFIQKHSCMNQETGSLAPIYT